MCKAFNEWLKKFNGGQEINICANDYAYHDMRGAWHASREQLLGEVIEIVSETYNPSKHIDVFYYKKDTAPLFFHLYGNIFGIRVFGDIGKGLLANAIEVDLDFTGKEVIDVFHIQCDINGVLFGKIFHQPLQRGKKAEVFQYRGHQVPGNAAYIFNDELDGTNYIFALFFQFFLAGFQLFSNGVHTGF